MPQPDVFRWHFSEILFALILGPGTQPFRSRPPPFGFQNAFLQAARPRPSLPANLFAALVFRFDFLPRLSFDHVSQSLSREFPILGLRPGILDRDAEAG